MARGLVLPIFQALSKVSVGRRRLSCRLFPVGLPRAVMAVRKQAAKSNYISSAFGVSLDRSSFPQERQSFQALPLS